MEVELTKDEMERLERYRQANAIGTLEEAFQRLATEEIHRRYRLPIRKASILNFEGLKRADKGNQDG